MLSSLHPKAPTIRKSKIIHKSPILRSLSRFVTGSTREKMGQAFSINLSTPTINRGALSLPHFLGTNAVTDEAVLLIFKIKLEDIYVVECWRHVVYVHAKGVSKFVSYADFPPIVGVEPANPAEIAMWRKRWQKQKDASQKKQAPKWWTNFFTYQFWQSLSDPILYDWGKLVRLINFAFTESTLQELRESFRRSRRKVVSG